MKNAKLEMRPVVAVDAMLLDSMVHVGDVLALVVANELRRPHDLRLGVARFGVVDVRLVAALRGGGMPWLVLCPKALGELGV